MANQEKPKKSYKFDLKPKSYPYMYNEKEAIVKKYYYSKDSTTDHLLRKVKEQISNEAKFILKCKIYGIGVPTLYLVDLQNGKIFMEYIHGQTIHDFLENNYGNTEAVTEILFNIGTLLGRMHYGNLYHGELNTSNMLLKNDGTIVLVNFSSSFLNPNDDDQVIDLYGLEKSFIKMHWNIMDKFWLILSGYEKIVPYFSLIYDKLKYLKAEFPVSVHIK